MDFLKRAVTLLLAALLAMVLAGPAAATTVHIAVPTQQSGQTDLAKAIRHALLQQDPALQVRILVIEATTQATGHGADLLITIGEQLLPWAAERREYDAILCFYTTARQFRAQQWRSPAVTALFREQPLDRQLELARNLLPQLSQLAMIYRKAEPPPQLPELPTATDLRITTVPVDDQPNWIRTLSELMVEHQALLAVEDPELYNRNTVRSILLTAYRHGRVLIGPSRPFVTAGSLASAYTTSDQYLAQLVDMSSHYLQRGQLPGPQYPRQFHVAINYQVAASLGMQLPPETEVAATLSQGEAR